MRTGRPGLPACVLVHGVGMSKQMWADPEEARVMGGLFPIRVMLAGHDERRTLYHDLADEGLTVLAWSQRRPVGPASGAIKELMQAVEVLRDTPHQGLILIGHSRGGLVRADYRLIRAVSRVLLYTVAVIVALSMVFPMFWMSFSVAA